MRTTICHRFTPHGIVTLKGAILRTVTANGPTDHVIETREAYQQTLRHRFGLCLPEPEVSTLWQKVWERHLARVT